MAAAVVVGRCASTRPGRGMTVDETIRQVLAEHGRLAVPIESLADDADLFGAGMTSHASVNVMLALEDAFDFEFSEKMLKKSTFESIAAIRAAVPRDDGGVNGPMTRSRATWSMPGPGTSWPPAWPPIADEVAGPAAADVDEQGTLPVRDDRRPAGRGAARRAGAGRVRRTGGLAGRGVRGPGGPRPPVRVERHGGGHAPHPGGLPGPPRAQRAPPRLPRASWSTTSTCWPRPPPRSVPGGDVRSSICAVEVADGRFRVEKQAPVISYGDDADAVLVTARRTPESPASDQVIVLCRPPGLELDQVGEWNALGLPGHVQHRVRPARRRGRAAGPRRPLRRHLHPDDAAGGPPAVELGVAGHRLGRRRPGPQVRAGRGPPQARDDAGRRAPPGRGDRGPPAVRGPGAVVAGPVRGGRRRSRTGCRRSASASP